MSESDLESRVQEMESRYMLLERYLDELSDVVAAQQQTIDGLLATVARLKPQLMNLEGQDPPVDERPPHY
jgi:uncharacterized coiled-coil protein SlyX